MEVFVYKWQTLIGSMLGPFLAIILSALGFWVQSIIKNKNERNESLRRIEISITQSLDSTMKMRQQLIEIAKRIKKLAENAKLTINGGEFCLDGVNFPPVREVYRDKEAPYFKIKSYYLHNKLLWIDAGIKEVNEINNNFKNDFGDLMRTNELLIDLIRKNPTPNPSAQRISYANNLENFANGIEEYLTKHIPNGIEIMTQIKIYNNHVRKRWGFYFLWKNEGRRFKFFKNKTTYNEYARNLDSIDHIDKIIKKEVDEAIKKAEERASKLAQDK